MHSSIHFHVDHLLKQTNTMAVVMLRNQRPSSFAATSLSSYGPTTAVLITVPLLLLLLANSASVTKAAPSSSMLLGQGSSSPDQLAELADLLASAAVASGGTRGAGGSGMVPRRPDNFRNLDELNQYMAEMRQFYSMLGRPR